MTSTDMTAERLSDPATLERITATIPMHRVATADEVAHPIVWLLSKEQASFVSGCIADVSGGGFLVGESLPRGGSGHLPALA
jgi:NAD(P)-dependent dehydrogenase (short-subunit alcohol dehydrogenase family)